jgi:transposase
LNISDFTETPVGVGIQLVQVNEKSTSKTCSRCGNVRKRNRKTRGLYVCNKCGYKINADVNGAVNILKKYLQPLGRSSANVGLAKVIRWDGNILFEP